MSRSVLGSFALAFWLIRLPFAVAQTTNATCASGYDWMQNSRKQSPCLMASYAQGACEPDGQWQVRDIPPGSNLTYSGPSSAIQITACTCSSVAYSLISACAACQNEQIPLWDEWIADCSTNMVSNGQYPHSIPAGTAFPAWAYLQVSGTAWNSADAQTLASSGYPESSAIGLQTTIGSSHSESATNTAGGASLTSAASPASASSAGAPTAPASNAGGKKSNTGAIVGGAVGGGLGTIILAGIAFWLVRYKPWRPKPAPSSNFADRQSMATASSPVYTAVPPVTSEPVMKLYNPDDPSTFPTTPAPLLANHGYPTNSTDNFPQTRPFSQA